jgi:hypothetical protein
MLNDTRGAVAPVYGTHTVGAEAFPSTTVLLVMVCCVDGTSPPPHLSA